MTNEASPRRLPHIRQPRKTRKRRPWVLPVAALLFVTVVVGGTFGVAAWWKAPCNSGGTSVSPPGPAAAPDQVMRTFFAAINDGDGPTVSAMIVPQARDVLLKGSSGEDIGISYVSNICRATNIEVRDATLPAPDDSGYAHAAAVIVDYDAELKHVGYQDRNGRRILEFRLVRDSDAEPWLILDKGHP